VKRRGHPARKRFTRAIVASLLAARAMMPVSADAGDIWLERNVSIDGGHAPLRGTLLVPEPRTAGATVRAALILAGSGPTDRNGNQPNAHTDKLKMMARALYAEGIATLRIDKRGIAASGPAMTSEAEIKLDHFIADAKAWLGFLRAQERIGRLFIIGHSEGALIATLAAPGENLGGLVLLAGIGAPLGSVLRRQLSTVPMPEALRRRAFDILAALEHGETVQDIPAELTALFRGSVQPFMISSLRRDPVAALAASTASVLVVQGTTDLQVSLDDAKLLAASRPGVELVVIEGMNHTLKLAPADRAAQMPAYTDPDLPLASALVPAVAGFIRRHAE
jgi:alpha-beta hydrolase superfamily lysophospholipase